MNEQLSNAIAALATKMGTTADHLWLILVHQARIEAITDTLSILLLVPICLTARKAYQMANKDDWDSPVFGIPAIILLAVSAGWAVYATACLFELPTLLLNPEYWALQQVLGQLHK